MPKRRAEVTYTCRSCGSKGPMPTFTGAMCDLCWRRSEAVRAFELPPEGRHQCPKCMRPRLGSLGACLVHVMEAYAGGSVGVDVSEVD